MATSLWDTEQFRLVNKAICRCSLYLQKSRTEKAQVDHQDKTGSLRTDQIIFND